MRASTFLATAILAGLVAACSRPDSDAASGSAPEDRDLTLVPVGESDAVASEIEAPRPAPTPAPEPRMPAARVATAPAPLGTWVDQAVHEHPADVEEAGYTGHPRMADEPMDVSGPMVLPTPTGGGKPRIPMREGRIPDPGAHGPILVRGGHGTIDDDCALHMPPRVGDVRPGGASVLVNDRAPRRGPPQTLAGGGSVMGGRGIR